ncbi:MAG: class I SAM-dependent methyltransferase [Planctomycetota bacterium]
MSTYEIAGIHDVDEFAAERYIGGPPGLDLERSLDAFDIRRGKVLWIYHNIKAGSSVLDFGCGVGRLAVLTRKNCKLYGVETSPAAAQRAEQAGYAHVLVGHLEQLLKVWGGRRFDYVVSLDVLEHILPQKKDAVIAGLKQLLKPSGLMLHGLECGPGENGANGAGEGRPKRNGIETRNRVLRRFQRTFRYVEDDLRLCHTRPIAHLLRDREHLKDDYGDLLSCLDTYDLRERRAFDTAMGVAFRSLEDSIMAPSTRGCMMVKASDTQLPRRRKLRSKLELPTVSSGQHVPFNSPALHRGWHPIEEDSGRGLYRWAEPTAGILFRAGSDITHARLDVSPVQDCIPTRFLSFEGGEAVPLAVTQLKREDAETAVIPLQKSSGSTVSLRLMVDRFSSPAWQGDGDDDRLLGFRLHGLSLV